MYYLGVDGGGTKTSAVLADADGMLIKKVSLGAGNIAVLGATQSKQLIRNIIESLAITQNLEKIAWGTFAFAGVGRKTEKGILREIVSSLGISNFSVMTDAEIQYYSVFEDQTGILIAAGTGSVCLIRQQEKFKQIGGWGYLLGDEGSGFDIGKRTIGKILNDHQNNQPESQLTKLVFEFYKVESVAALTSLIYSQSNPQNLIASCAELICEQSERLNPDAVKIVTESAESLLKLAGLATLEIDASSPYRLALCGSVLQASSAVSSQFKRLANKSGFAFEYAEPKLSPVAAALLNSIKSAGGSVSETTRINLGKI